MDIIPVEQKDLFANRHVLQDIALLGGGGAAEANHSIGRVSGSSVLRQIQIGELVIAPWYFFVSGLSLGSSAGVGLGSTGVGLGLSLFFDISSTNASRIS